MRRVKINEAVTCVIFEENIEKCFDKIIYHEINLCVYIHNKFYCIWQFYESGKLITNNDLAKFHKAIFAKHLSKKQVDFSQAFYNRKKK